MWSPKINRYISYSYAESNANRSRILRAAMRNITQQCKNSEIINNIFVFLQIYMMPAIPKRFCHKSVHAENRSLTLYLLSYTILKIRTLHVHFTSTQYRDSMPCTYVGCCQSCSFLSSPRHRSYWGRHGAFSLADIFCNGNFSFIFPGVYFVSHQSSSSSSISLAFISVVRSPSIAFFKSFLDKDFGKSAKDRGLKINADVEFNEKKDGKQNVPGSATMPVAGLTDADEF